MDVLGPINVVKRVYDEVHGYIELTDIEKRIIDTPTFQRLRFIRQLASAWYVYPGATHTRFSHSLGTLYIMGRLASRLYSMGYIYHKDDVQLLRLVALLHDVGHTPFSHAIEPFFRERLGLGHEDLTRLMIMVSPDISEALESYGYDPKEIVAILEGKHRETLYNQLISSELDVDRMDYLLRDSLHTGVAYGSIDIHRLLATMVVDGEGNLAVLEKGLGALENFYIARMHMYRNVYYHKTIVGFELVLRRIYEKLYEVCEDELLFKGVEDVRRAIYDGLIAFWNDEWLIGLMIRCSRSSRSRELRELVESFVSRRGYKVLLDMSGFLDDEKDLRRDEEFKRVVECLQTKCSELPLEVFVDDIVIVSNDRSLMPRIITRAGRSVPVLDIEYTVINRLPRVFRVRRIYAPQSCVRDAELCIERCLH